MSWKAICDISDLPTNAGVAAMVNGRQIAVFLVKDQLFAIDNYDPVGKANVLSRGIVGSIKGNICVASPLYKQHFVLATGECMEDDVSVAVYPVRLHNGHVEVDSSAVVTDTVAA